MLFLFITVIVCGSGELLILFLFSRRQKKRKKEIRKSLYKLMEERVLSKTLQNHITSEQAADMEYRSSFLEVEFLDTKPWMCCIFALDEAVTIGRSRENKISIRDDMLSRLHCKIVSINQQLYLQDMGTANGTRIRRGMWKTLKLAPQEIVPLEDKDKIIAGNYRMRILILHGYEAGI